MKTFIKIIFIAMTAIMFAGCKANAEYVDNILIDGGKFHVQGIAYDSKEKCMYSSFTSAFYKTDLEGTIIGSVININGHLGAMTFDKKGRKVYASLELKNDVIGQSISKGLGVESYTKEQSKFYVAEIDVDKITGLDMEFNDVVTLHPIEDAGKDYAASVMVDSTVIEHKYGCSGIDGVTIGPAFGSKNKRDQYLYVGYGIYGDVKRKDNDYNIILCYKLDDLSKPVHKYFVFTGNTRYGIQNMGYDPYTNQIFLAVYKGRKPEYPNYSLFALDMAQEPFMAKLDNVPYEENEVEQLKVAKGWHFKWGSTGFCPLGDGNYYISENSKEHGKQKCLAKIYTYEESEDSPFIRK